LILIKETDTPEEELHATCKVQQGQAAQKMCQRGASLTENQKMEVKLYFTLTKEIQSLEELNRKTLTALTKCDIQRKELVLEVGLD
jgi:hypothetical protein